MEVDKHFKQRTISRNLCFHCLVVDKKWKNSNRIEKSGKYVPSLYGGIWEILTYSSRTFTSTVQLLTTRRETPIKSRKVENIFPLFIDHNWMVGAERFRPTRAKYMLQLCKQAMLVFLFFFYPNRLLFYAVKLITFPLKDAFLSFVHFFDRGRTIVIPFLLIYFKTLSPRIPSSLSKV